MARRNSNNTWLNLRAGLGDLILQEHHQAYARFNEFAFPQKQFPQMVMFIGGQIKTLALRKLRFGPQAQEVLPDEVHLRVEPGSVNDESPLLIADCEMHNSPHINKVVAQGMPGNIIQRPVVWHKLVPTALDPMSLSHLIYSKLLSQFSTVICFFADDFGGLAALARLLAVWIVTLSNRPSDLPLHTHPRVLILQRWHDRSTFDEQVATKHFMLELGREAEKKNGILTENKKGKLKKAELDRLLAQQFGGMRVLAIPDVESVPRSWKSLKSRILQDSDDIQKRRRDAQVAFSVRHFKAFFGAACEHFCKDIVSSFNFIRASRISNPIEELELEIHLAGFLELVDANKLFTFAVSVIGSALVFDSYPPGAHAFNPPSVFRQFFYQTCLHIYPRRRQDHFRDKSSSMQLVSGIERAFCKFASDVIKSEDDGLAVHQMALARFKDEWRSLHSNKICFSCFARQPESSLQCHHSLCALCTRAHGNTTAADPWTFTIERCPFCHEKNNISFPQKPDTAGVRALVVEGGGTRGIIPLTFLEELERAIGLQEMHVQEHFDIAFGNSAGALVVLGLYSKLWTVEDCVKNFLSLAGSAFRRRICDGLPFISSQPVQVLLSFITDSKYSSAGINSALKSAYGQGRLFEMQALGTKVAVIATTTDDSSTCILGNYNGPRYRPINCGYRFIRPDNDKKELLTWEAARASSAAPPYFKSFHGYQDGGLGGHNNPIDLALWEQDIIWSRSKKQPDVVLSLGTGFKRNSEENVGDVKKLSFFQSRYVPRLLRSFLNFFDGEVRWQELQNHLLPQNRNRYHRMNIEFYGPEPKLDDLQLIPSLRQQARCQALSHNDIRQCADNIIASLFYLELDGLPEFDQSSFVCVGRICCRVGPSHPVMRTLMGRLADARFYLDFQQLIPCIDASTSETVEGGGPFTRPVTFRVASLDHSIDIKIDGIIQRARSISNCPYIVRTLINDQGLDCAFGSRRLKRKGSNLNGPEPKRHLGHA